MLPGGRFFLPDAHPLHFRVFCFVPSPAGLHSFFILP